MRKVYEVFNLELETITPLHIGDGSSLLPMEYIFHEGKLYVVNLDWLLNAFPDFADKIPEGMFYLAEKLVDSRRTSPDMLVGKLVREHGADRVMKVFDRQFNPKAFREIRTFIKDRHGKAYVPGSSIKGALRTAAAFYLVKGGKRFREDVETLFREREEKGFNDVFKAIAVSDALPLSQEDGTLQVVKSQRIGSSGRRTGGRPLINYWEIVPPGSRFAFTIKIHRGYTGEWAEKTGLGSDPKNILTNLLGAANYFSRAVVEAEKKKLPATKNKISSLSSDPRNKTSQEQLYSLAESFYLNATLKIPSSSGEAVLSMSRGTGKHRKTVRLALGENEWQMPITREVIADPAYRDKPLFGWVMLRLKEN